MPKKVPIEPDLFRVGGEWPVLLGSRCPACGETFYPRRWTCPICLGSVEDVELSHTGTLYSYSFIAMPMFGKVACDAQGYSVGQVDLPEGVRVQSVLEGDPASWNIGDQMSLTYTTVELNEDGDEERVLYSFAKIAQQ
ncbi:MAG: Zn-ribbon domain-containing OB-fold protein [Mycobacterium sp.]